MGNSPSQSEFHPPPHPKSSSGGVSTTMPRPNSASSASQPASSFPSVAPSFSWPTINEPPQSIDSLAVDAETKKNHRAQREMSPCSLDSQRHPLVDFHLPQTNNNLVQSGYEVRNDQDVLHHYDSLDQIPKIMEKSCSSPSSSGFISDLSIQVSETSSSSDKILNPRSAPITREVQDSKESEMFAKAKEIINAQLSKSNKYISIIHLNGENPPSSSIPTLDVDQPNILLIHDDVDNKIIQEDSKLCKIIQATPQEKVATTLTKVDATSDIFTQICLNEDDNDKTQRQCSKKILLCADSLDEFETLEEESSLNLHDSLDPTTPISPVTFVDMQIKDEEENNLNKCSNENNDKDVKALSRTSFKTLRGVKRVGKVHNNFPAKIFAEEEEEKPDEEEDMKRSNTPVLFLDPITPNISRRSIISGSSKAHQLAMNRRTFTMSNNVASLPLTPDVNSSSLLGFRDICNNLSNFHINSPIKGDNNNLTLGNFVFHDQSTILYDPDVMPPSLSESKEEEMNGEDHDNELEETLALEGGEGDGTLREQPPVIKQGVGDTVSIELAKTNKAEADGKLKKTLDEFEKRLCEQKNENSELKVKLGKVGEENVHLINDRDQALEDLSNAESAFADVHRKYERVKTMVASLKENENTLIRRDEDLVQKVAAREKQLEVYKQKAQEKLELMHHDNETRTKDYESEITRLRAQCRLMEMKLLPLQNDVMHKAEEITQLRSLCDELIEGQKHS